MASVSQLLDVSTVESLLGWWHDAGVDMLIDETPRNWIATPSARVVRENAAPRPPRATPSVAPVVPAAPLADTLEAFIAWLMSDAAVPEGGPPARRVAPAGDPASSLMVLTDVPETGDVEARGLFTGDAGALFDRMLGALGRERAAVYLATMSPARPPNGRLAEAAIERLTPIARHHVALAAPKKLWLMGRAASCALLGMDEAEAAGRLHSINLKGITVDAIATVHPNILLREEASGKRTLRKAAWADMQRLIEEPTT